MFLSGSTLWKAVRLGCGCAALVLQAEVVPAALFGDHAVLQQGVAVPVWGTAAEGEQVTVSFAGQSVTTTACDGRWLVRLAPLAAGGPHTLTITGRNRVVISDVLVGEVWVCSGQSNMEMKLGPAQGMQPVVNWQEAVAAAELPQLRYFNVPRAHSLRPLAGTDARWEVCSSATAPDFSAVAFFFGRALQQARPGPLGLIHSSWGGSLAEAWMSREALDRQPDFAADLENQRLFLRDPVAAQAAAGQRLADWYAINDSGTAAAWHALADTPADWGEMEVPGVWEKAGLPDFNGVVWFRREFDLPEAWAGRAAELHLGAVDDEDTTWVNGQSVGASQQWDKLRVYPVPAGRLHAGRNVVTVRVLDTGGGGGLWGNGDAIRLVPADAPGLPSISLEGKWRLQPGPPLANLPPPPRNTMASVATPGALFNGMIAPFQPYALRGVIWYQGESNASRAQQYRTLFPALIADWRRGWGQGDFPFLFVQIAPYKGMRPEIREAQMLTLRQSPHTAMVVTVDVGDEQDIHPPHKQPVGERLALAARVLAYGEQLEYSGPLYESAEFKAGRAVLRFSHVGGGLVAPGGELQGFTLAGADKIFRPAKAVIVGDTVEVQGEGGAVRYAWAGFARGNLFNRAGLPASPFRTDPD
jgi:sialate O-acetylesterase